MIHIEVGGREDCTAVLPILQAAFAPYIDNLQPPSGVFSETVHTLEKKCETNTLLLAQNEQGIVGCVFYTVQKGHPENLYLGRLAVLPELQGRGIARELVLQVEQAARGQGYEKVALYVRKVLTANITFFQSCGYEIYAEGTHKGFTEPTYYKMAKAMKNDGGKD